MAIRSRTSSGLRILRKTSSLQARAKKKERGRFTRPSLLKNVRAELVTASAAVFATTTATATAKAATAASAFFAWLGGVDCQSAVIK